MTQYAQAAKAIRQELKGAFPTVKFSVRSQGYSMGDHVEVRYDAELAPEKIHAIVDKYQYGHFDGMTDYYESSNQRDDIPQSKYVFVYRNGFSR